MSQYSWFTVYVHWKKENLKEKLLFNPVAINWIQYGVGLLLLLIMCMYFLKFQSEAEIFKNYVYTVMQITLDEEPEMFDKINRLVEVESLYNVEISNYLTMDGHMFIFCALWFVFQLKTYKELFTFPFSKRIITLYLAIACKCQALFYFVR